LDPSLPQSWGEDALSGNGDPNGRTIRNEPGAFPDPSAVAEYQAEEARRKIQGWAEDTLAQRRVETGIVDNYYNDLRHALEREGSVNPGIPREVFENPKQGVGNLFEGLGSAANRYGTTGNPYPEQSPDTVEVRDRNSHNAQAAIRDPLGQTPGGAIARELERSAPGGQLLKDAVGQFLRAVVEIRQSPEGAITSTMLVESSGNAKFDQHVLATAPRAVSSVAPPGHPVSAKPDGIRTVWEFKGSLDYRKKMRDFGKGREVDKVAGAVASILTGSFAFEETTGDVYVPDFADPTFKMKVKLLRVY
jgi:hypothetical protein